MRLTGPWGAGERVTGTGAIRPAGFPRSSGAGLVFTVAVQWPWESCFVISESWEMPPSLLQMKEAEACRGRVTCPKPCGCDQGPAVAGRLWPGRRAGAGSAPRCGQSRGPGLPRVAAAHHEEVTAGCPGGTWLRPKAPVPGAALRLVGSRASLLHRGLKLHICLPQ